MSSSLIDCVIPWFGGNPTNLHKTIDSVKGICDDVIIVHQLMFDDDAIDPLLLEFGDAMVETTDWNHVIIHGYGSLPNMGMSISPWRLLLGVGETIAEQHKDIRQALLDSDPKKIYKCNHNNDVHKWNRIWNPSSGNHYAGLIHEDVRGDDGGLLFRMQDTDKLPLPSHYKNDVLKWFKACSYNILYKRLLDHPDELSHTDPGWLKFVAGASESINDFCQKNKDMVDACISGDREKFIDVCRIYTDNQSKVYGINLNKLGEVMSE